MWRPATKQLRARNEGVHISILLFSGSFSRQFHLVNVVALALRLQGFAPPQLAQPSPSAYPRQFTKIQTVRPEAERNSPVNGGAAGKPTELEK